MEGDEDREELTVCWGMEDRDCIGSCTMTIPGTVVLAIYRIFVLENRLGAVAYACNSSTLGG